MTGENDFASRQRSSEFAQSLFAAVDVALVLQDAEAAMGITRSASARALPTGS
jgi:hypothetical protein